MKIETLHLKDFRCHKDSQLTLDKLTLITGGNASGKSSIAAGIEFLLTGRAMPFTDSAGRGADDLIRIGAAEFTVKAKIGQVNLTRHKSARAHTLEVNGRPGELRQLQQKIYEGLKVPADVLSGVLNAGRFIDMDEKEQKALLANVLASDKAKITPEILSAMESINMDVHALAEMSLSEIDYLYKDFYDQRTEANRDIKSLGKMDPPELPEDMPDGSMVRETLAQRNNELINASNERTRMEERHNSALRARERTAEDRRNKRSMANLRILNKDTEEELQATSTHVKEFTDLSRRKSTLENTLTSMIAAFNKGVITAQVSFREKLQGISQRIVEAEESIEAISSLPEADCPLCHQEMTPEKKEALLDKYRETITNLREERDAASLPDQQETPQIQQQRRELESVNSELERIGDPIAAEQKLRVHREAVVEVSRYDLEQRQEKAIADPDYSSLDKKIKDLRERIAKGSEVLAAIQAAESKQEAYDRHTDMVKQLEEKVQTLDRLIEYFGPNGVKASMVGDKIGPFTENMNRSLGAFGYTVSFTIEPYLFIVGRHQDGSMRALRQLAESERFRFGVAFQIALAKATGLNFVLVDRADVLEPNARVALSGMLLESGLDQAIVLSTTDPERPVPEELPEGVRVIQL